MVDITVFKPKIIFCCWGISVHSTSYKCKMKYEHDTWMKSISNANEFAIGKIKITQIKDMKNVLNKTSLKTKHADRTVNIYAEMR